MLKGVPVQATKRWGLQRAKRYKTH